MLQEVLIGGGFVSDLVGSFISILSWSWDWVL